ncbi:hypothetical protein [Acinetobacter gyllenbergii]|uniref:hypothetical protein n=1 Tax=Acinetobacter gyllenbergii TaxID=134534 RepID=UPI0003BEAE62|nr:hypothetical protein [Acinetobacter gyllenbergii]ESK37974.1 hypothetical protein F987_03305 [Acinetobacter gyllenbergii NIPH 230]
MTSPYKKYTYILGLVSLSLLACSCSTTSEKKHEISDQSQIKKGSSIPTKLKNDDGFLITSLPYNSNAHLNCILSAQRINCGSINLIDSSRLIKVYNFINPRYGDSVVFPETSTGILLIASPSSSEAGNPEINLTTVNKFGLAKSITLDASQNIVINQKYEILYKEDRKDLKLKLNDQGEFVK